MTDKEAMRREMREAKRLHTFEERQKISSDICSRLLQHPKIRQAKIILLYHSLPDEVQTNKLLTDLEAMILLPVIVGNNLELRVYEGEKHIKRETTYNIGEPTGPVFTAYNQIDAAIIPGMAFDRLGHRLGRGKGYYDRLLPKLATTYKIGVCFPYQLKDNVPTEPHDVLMDDVIC